MNERYAALAHEAARAAKDEEQRFPDSLTSERESDEEGGLHLYVAENGAWCVTTPTRDYRNPEASTAVMWARLTPETTRDVETLAAALRASIGTDKPTEPCKACSGATRRTTDGDVACVTPSCFSYNA